LVHRIVACFESNICRFSDCDNRLMDEEGAAALQSNAILPAAGNFFDPTECFRLEGALEGVLRNGIGIVFVVLKPGLDRFTLKNCVVALGRAFPSQMPVILTRSLFTYRQRHYDPFEYGHLMKFREVLFGDDPIPKIRPPSRNSIVGYLLGQVPNILTFPCSRNVILLNPALNSFLVREAQRLAERALLVRLYLEKRALHLRYNEFLGECEKHYPEEFVKLRALTAKQNGTAAPQEWFSWLKALANDVHTRLQNSTRAAGF
jgi:hypothetical protein